MLITPFPSVPDSYYPSSSSISSIIKYSAFSVILGCLYFSCNRPFLIFYSFSLLSFFKLPVLAAAPDSTLFPTLYFLTISSSCVLCLYFYYYPIPFFIYYTHCLPLLLSFCFPMFACITIFSYYYNT